MASAARDLWTLLRAANAPLEASIAGVSMLPTLSDAARVRIRPDAQGDYRVGEVVVCVLRDELFAHRVLHRRGVGAHAAVVTLGDNRRLCDPPTYVRDILGRVEAVWERDAWRPLPPPSRRVSWPTALHGRFVAACLMLHFELARRFAGTSLLVARRWERWARSRHE